MAMVNVVTIAAYRRIYWLRLIGLVQIKVGGHLALHSSGEPGELSQWQCTATIYDSTINIVVGIITRDSRNCYSAS